MVTSNVTNLDLHGKTAIVTGGGRGIGRATCLALARCGAKAFIVARHPREIEEVAQEIAAGGGDAEAVSCDVSDADAVRRLVKTTGPVHILVNNAGTIQPITPASSMGPDAWNASIAVNLNAVFLTCRYVLPGMMGLDWGRIVNVTSGAAKGQPRWSAYSAAKAGVEAFTKSVAGEVEQYGITVNAVRPGIVDTQMQVEIRQASVDGFGRENLSRFQGYKVRGLLRPPEEPARLIMYLLSPEADQISGEVLIIDDPATAAKVGLKPTAR